MPRTEFLQIRVTPEDRERFRRVAQAEHLDLSTWARRTLLQAIDQFEDRTAIPRRRVAEPSPEKPDPRRRK
jgi:hypothetical protein